MSVDPVTVKPLAEDDLEEAANWYDKQTTGLGEQFLRAVDTVFERPTRSPETYGVVYGNVRAASVRKFTYVVYYTFDQTSVAVLGVLHGHRNDGVWKSRVE